MEKLIVPPIRTCLEDVNSRIAGDRNNPPPLTDKSWYLYWRRMGEAVSGLVGTGTHANRPDPGTAPDGGLYNETDRGNVLYQNVNGSWQYVAGTMWGTLNPDQRPTDLGPNDAGFEFRSVDADPSLNGRDFLWSQSEWIEITPVRYGTHAQRLASTPASLWPGMLFVETDRGNVVYEVQIVSGSAAWVYVAGAMYGTLIATDQRPTDLGANDKGFRFLSSDSTSIRWSGTNWAPLDRILDLGPTPAMGQLVLKANGLGALGLICYAADNPTMSFDAEYTGSAWAARFATVAFITKSAGKLHFQGSIGNTVGGAPAQTMRMQLDLATGNLNITGVYQVAGTQVVGARLAAIGAPAVATINMTRVPGNTYTSNEKDMLSDLAAAVNQLNADVLNLQTAINDTRSRLQTHGLTS